MLQNKGYDKQNRKFDKNHTNLNIPFLEFSNLYKEGNNPVVLITDGILILRSKLS